MRQREMLRELLGDSITIRKARLTSAAVRRGIHQSTIARSPLPKNRVIGFVVTRQDRRRASANFSTAPFDAAERRPRSARRLPIEREARGSPGEVVLEVRESNWPAIRLYDRWVQACRSPGKLLWQSCRDGYCHEVFFMILSW